MKVSLSQPINETVTVNYSTANNSAVSGSDYIAKSGTLTFAPNQTTQSISVDIVNDGVVEELETFFVNLSNPSSNAVITDNQGLVSIINDDSLNITIEDITVSESSGTASVKVSLSQAINSTVTVNYSTANNSAISGSDYVATSGTLTFAPNQTSQTITVNLLEDNLVEGNESFFINLSNPSSNGILTDTQGIVTIEDNDKSNSTAIFNSSPNSPFAVGVSPRFVKAVDLNNDSYLDLVVTNLGSSDISVFLNNGSGDFSFNQNYVVGITPNSIASGDLNKDGNQDVVINNVLYGNVTILLGNGLGGFQNNSLTVQLEYNQLPTFIKLADFNEDGNLDLVVITDYSDQILVLSGDGTGNFNSILYSQILTNPSSVAVSDFDGDNHLDLVVSNIDALDNITNGDITILKGDGHGNFGQLSNLSVTTNPFSVAVGDVDNDGDPDVVTANLLDFQSYNISLFKNNGSGSLSCHALKFLAQKPCYKDSGLQNIKFSCGAA